MASPKHLHDLTVRDLQRHRWCYYHNDAAGFDAFEYVIPDTHTEFDESIMEVELAVFTFKSGQQYLGMFDGSRQFQVFLNESWRSFWFGRGTPSPSQVQEIRQTLHLFELSLPVIAESYWSRVLEEFNGLKYINDDGAEVELPI